MSNDYVINPKRIPVESPESLVENGKALFGTFASEIVNINLLDCIDPCGSLMPEMLKSKRLTVWEAFELSTEKGLLVCCVYNAAVAGFTIFVYFDKETQKCLKWFELGTGKDAVVAPSLCDTVTEMHTKTLNLTFENNMQNGRCHISGDAANKVFGSIELDVNVRRLSPPSVVNIPFGENKPLYSQKDFFAADGYITVNSDTTVLSPSCTAIIDDHKGFYPFVAHYDWLTAMGTVNGKYFAFNLTRNQSTDQSAYNENLIWVEGKSFPLPPITFQKNGSTWHILDTHGLVDIRFDVEDIYKMQVHLGLFDIDYNLPFGKLSGYVKNAEGDVFRLDGLYGIAEDKSTRI